MGPKETGHFIASQREVLGQDSEEGQEITPVEKDCHFPHGGSTREAVMDKGRNQTSQWNGRSHQEAQDFACPGSLFLQPPKNKSPEDKGSQQHPGRVELHIPEKTEAHHGKGQAGRNPFQRKLW